MKILIERKFAVTFNYPIQWHNWDWEKDNNGNIVFFDTEKQAKEHIEELKEKYPNFEGWYEIRHQDTMLESYEENLEKIEENNKNDELFTFRYSAGVDDEEKGIHGAWSITVKAENSKEARKKLITEIGKKWNEKYPNTPLPIDYLSYCRL